LFTFAAELAENQQKPNQNPAYYSFVYSGPHEGDTDFTLHETKTAETQVDQSQSQEELHFLGVPPGESDKFKSIFALSAFSSASSIGSAAHFPSQSTNAEDTLVNTTESEGFYSACSNIMYKQFPNSIPSRMLSFRLL
jgi:hypothetical protein